MPKSAAFRVGRDDRGRWCINLPASVTANGKRQRRFYKTRDAAKADAEHLREKFREHGLGASAIPPALADDATTAAELLTPLGASLTEAAKFFAEARAKRDASVSVEHAVEAWLSSCDGLRPKTLAGYRHVAGKLISALGGRVIATLTADEIRDAIMPPGTPPTSCAVNYRTAKACFRWAAKRGWCAVETFDKIESPRKSSADEIEILTPAEAARLLAVAEEHFPAAVPMFAVQLFAGVRAEEAEKLSASDVSPDGIELAAAVAKKGRRRHIAPCLTLADWLRAHPFGPCPNWRAVSAAVRCLAGWKVKPSKRFVSTLPRDFDKREPWPQNAMRHSHATYSVAAGVPLERLLFEFGHAGNPTVLRQHYVGRSSKKQALEFFAIHPGGRRKFVELETVKTA